jgi:glycosyltransferase involved in cell wall biosynthesis
MTGTPPLRGDILALAAVPPRGAATRYRVFGLREALAARGFGLTLVSLLDDATFADWYGATSRVAQMRALAKGSLAMTARAWMAAPPAAVFVQREACFVGPELIERLTLARHGCPFVFDLDDAIWLPQSQGSRLPRLSAWLRSTAKSERMIARADLVVAGSRHLEQGARARAARRTVYAPTVVDTDTWTPLDLRVSGGFVNPEEPVIGWVGTHTTAPQLEMVVPALRKLRAEGFHFRFRVVGAGQGFSISGLDAVVEPWDESREHADFRAIDIGLAPMFDTEWTRGKCAFKQIQYMSVGVPFVTSPVGAVREVVDDGVEGLYAESDDAWYTGLRRLLESASLRAALGTAGRARALRELNRDVVSARVAEAIEAVVDDAAARGPGTFARRAPRGAVFHEGT